MFCGIPKKLELQLQLSENRRTMSAEDLSQLPLNHLLHEEIAEEESTEVSPESSLNGDTQV